MYIWLIALCDTIVFIQKNITIERIFNVNYFPILIYFVPIFYRVQIVKNELVLRVFSGSNVQFKMAGNEAVL